MTKASASMGSTSKRNKGRFAGLPLFVLESEAYVTLPPLAKCLLYELAAQYSSHNNGYLSLTRDDLRARGYPSTNSNTKAIKSLIESALITQTRIGGIAKGRRLCNLYAINWQPIDGRTDKPIDETVLFKGGFQVWLSSMAKSIKIIAR